MRIELWRTTLCDDVVDALVESGTALNDNDYSTEQLVIINDAGECAIIANIYPGKPITKKIQMSRL